MIPWFLFHSVGISSRDLILKMLSWTILETVQDSAGSDSDIRLSSEWSQHVHSIFIAFCNILQLSDLSLLASGSLQHLDRAGEGVGKWKFLATLCKLTTHWKLLKNTCISWIVVRYCEILWVQLEKPWTNSKTLEECWGIQVCGCLQHLWVLEES